MRQEKIVFAGRQDVGVGDSAGRDDARDFALHELHTFLRRFHLIADGDLVAFPEQAGDVAVGSVIGNTAHRHGIVAILVAGSQRDFEFARSGDGVFEEEFVEVTKTKQEQGIGRFLFYGMVLPHHRGEIFVHGL